MNRIKDDSVIEIKLQKSVNIGRRQIHFRWLPNKFTTQLSLEVDQFQGRRRGNVASNLTFH